MFHTLHDHTNIHGIAGLDRILVIKSVVDRYMSVDVVILSLPQGVSSVIVFMIQVKHNAQLD